MLEGSMAVVKPEMKSYIWVQTADGSVQQVEEEVAMFCPMICREVLQTGTGSCKTNAIALPQRVNSAIFGLILNYCQFHQVPGRSNKERKTFDEKFVRLDTKNLCELASAADSLQLRPLVDITCRALARMIEGRTPEEIRETFNIPDDLTEEEKLEPLKNITDDPHIRLLNRLYARKRKELRERHQLKNVEVEEERVDERSVDDLLSFINGENGDSKGTGGTKNKKKNRRKKDQQRKLSSNEDSGNSEKHFGAIVNSKVSTCQNNTVVSAATPNKTSGLEDNITCSACKNDLVRDVPPLKTSKLEDKASAIFATDLDFDDDDIDDELDPAVKEELDREVEDFARRLNSVWPERMQEILSFGQERKLAPIYVNGTGSLNRYTGSKQ